MDKIRDRDNAILLARKITSAPFVTMDTETTGKFNAEACSIALVNECGKVWESLVKPNKPIEADATNIHKITNEMVASAPTLLDVKEEIYLFVSGTPIVIYNAKFDVGVVKRGIPDFKFGTVYDAMTIYSEYAGYWDDYHGNYRWHKLGVACAACGLKVDEGSQLHGAAVDAEMTRRLLLYVAAQKTSKEMNPTPSMEG